LGQGGQQILRAVMANLLNTTSDSRSRNMLHGLGFAEEDITDIENIRKKVDNFAEPDERTKMKLERLFGSKANLLAINLGPELEQLLRQPYSYIWGKAGDSQYRQYNDELTRRPSPNLMLLDPILLSFIRFFTFEKSPPQNRLSETFMLLGIKSGKLWM